MRRLLLLALAAVLPACNVDPFHIGVAFDGGGGGMPDADPLDPDADVTLRPDAGPLDASVPDACIPSPEICDHQDQDCDGVADNGFNVMSDPENCNDCGIKCELPGSAGTCNMGSCEFACLSGFHDLDPLAPGCEYACIPTNGGVEACDGLDNDCDDPLILDEDFNTANDPDNCGACGHTCNALHATPTCTTGMCGYSACDSGFADLLPGVPGCEYACPVNPPVAETCNNRDDDCDGMIDDGNPGGGVACGNTVGECSAGTTLCQFGVQLCVGSVGPTAEICDQKDNDCDTGQPGGGTDENFATQTDPFHCGASCTVCNLPNAVEKCTAGVCQVNFCLPGFINFNGTQSDGCEFGCTPTGPEVCDGIDNDCDKLLDAMDPSMIAAPPGLCASAGGCAGGTAQCKTTACDPTASFHCVYGANAETDACGDLKLQETRCDGLDGDCDGQVDDAFPTKGSACGDNLLGQCRGTGSLICNAAHTGLTCNITSPGATPVAETCNDKDDDCDGMLDEGAPDSVVHVVANGLDFFMYTYEASRPDATVASAGGAEHRSCSKAGVQPWRSVDFTDASAACVAAGRRLCTEAEWEAACAGPTATARFFPYGNAYDPDACNGNDHDSNCVAPDNDVSLPTGTAYDCPGGAVSPTCVSQAGAFDLSGNLKEWTSTMVSSSPVAFRIRGGAFDSIAPGLTCQFAFQAGEPDFLFDNLGFRCCSNTP